MGALEEGGGGGGATGLLNGGGGGAINKLWNFHRYWVVH